MYAAVRSTHSAYFGRRRNATHSLHLSVCSRDFHIVNLLIVGSVVIHCASGYPTPPTFQASRLPAEPLNPSPRLRTFNASGIRGLLTARRYQTEAIAAHVVGPISQVSGFMQMGSSEPNEELPGFTSDRGYDLKMDEENRSNMPSPSLVNAELDFTPGLTDEPTDASPSLPNDSEDENEESPEFMFEPVPSSPCEQNNSHLEASPEFMTDPVLTPEPTNASLISADYSDPGATPELLAEPALSPDTVFPSPTMQPAFGNADEATAAPGTSATNPEVSSIEGLMVGAESVVIAVSSLIVILSIVVAVLTVTLLGTYHPYRPFVTSTLSDSSLDNVGSPRSGHYGARIPEARRISPRYEATSLESREDGP